jgi:orotate phosphoribosyltransferase
LPSTELARRIHKRSYLTGQFVLRSGGETSVYVDKYAFEGDPALLLDIADAMLPLLPDDLDALAGLELGGIPLATVLSQLAGLPTRFVRKQAKNYGTCRLAEGGEIAARRVAVIEDVVTSGGQVIESCRELRAREADISAVLCVIDREAGGRENLAAEGLDLRSLYTMSQLREGRATDRAGTSGS